MRTDGAPGHGRLPRRQRCRRASLGAAESQCAADVAEDKILSLKKEFKSSGGSVGETSMASSENDNNQDALVKQLIEEILQYLLQILK